MYLNNGLKLQFAMGKDSFSSSADRLFFQFLRTKLHYRVNVYLLRGKSTFLQYKIGQKFSASLRSLGWGVHFSVRGRHAQRQTCDSVLYEVFSCHKVISKMT